MITIWIAAVYAAAVFITAYTALMTGLTAWDRGKAIVDSQ
jgi:predicted small integral membrane protein